MNEFDLIQNFFNRGKKNRTDVVLGIGDDAALLQVPLGQQLVVSTDTLVAGRHFPENTSPADIAYKALAVNLSDLAAMGAEPAWILLALTLPSVNEIWLKEFSQGFFSLMQDFRLQLVGGDMTCGPLSITVQALGFVPAGKALCRLGARPGDRLYVSGTLGDAGLALAYLRKETSLVSLTQQQIEWLMQRLNRPKPRVELGLALRNIATSAIDISDGLVADLNHILAANQLGATIQLADLPLSAVLQQWPREQAWSLALSAGDDYELCFTVPESCEIALQSHVKAIHSTCICIGQIKKEPGLSIIRQDGSLLALEKTGFQHFMS
ncbi:MAG: thiamine-monophosphate kinase [Pseudomonadota bacterium]|jgi:thiamine-monophosphate kinase